MNTYTIAHTTWNCKYHVVFAPKYRRKAFYGGRCLEIGHILRELCRWKGISIIEAEVCPDHVHILVSRRAKVSPLYEYGREEREKYNIVTENINIDKRINETISEIKDFEKRKLEKMLKNKV